MGELGDLKYEFLEYPPFASDLTLSDYLLFPNIEECLSGKRFSSNEEIVAVVDGYCKHLPEPHVKDGIYLFKKRRTKCIESDGGYKHSQTKNNDLSPPDRNLFILPTYIFYGC